MSFPSREMREQCWKSRDKYWQCLDENTDDQVSCVAVRRQYEAMCPSQWVKHFDRKRTYMKFKDRIQNEGIPNQASPYLSCQSLASAEPIVRRHRIYRQVVMT